MLLAVTADAAPPHDLQPRSRDERLAGLAHSDKRIQLVRVHLYTSSYGAAVLLPSLPAGVGVNSGRREMPCQSETMF